MLLMLLLLLVLLLLLLLTPYDSDDEEEETEEFKVVEVFDEEWKPTELRCKTQDIIWFDDSQDVVHRANEYENSLDFENQNNDRQENTEEGMAIISKGQLVAYITEDVIWKTKFYEHEKYEQCFTSGGVGKAKFIEQMKEQKLNFTYGDNPLLMDADRSGFYSRTEESSRDNKKYDQNKAYKSFSKSGLFNGFPILEATFKIDKPFSEFTAMTGSTNPNGSPNSAGVSGGEGSKHGLLYVEWETLTHEKLNNKLYYEGNGWYPIEIVKDYYDKYNINPFIKSYAYASETFNVDFTNFTNEQFPDTDADDTAFEND